MTEPANLHDLFEELNDDFLKFERIESPRSKRPDLHAFSLLDELCPGTRHMVIYATHDEITLDVDPDKLAQVITRAQALELVRCGVRVGDEAVVMFV